MLSFFEMLGLLEAKASKKKTAKDALTDSGASTPAQVEPAVSATPQYSKTNPHPNAGKITWYDSGRTVDGKWVDYTPEEIEASRRAEEERQAKQSAGTVMTDAQKKRAEREAAEAERVRALKDYQARWEKLRTDVENLAQTEKDPAKIANQLGASVEDVEEILNPPENDPFADGSDNARPVSQLSKKEIERLAREERQRKDAAETKMGATGLRDGGAKYAADQVPLWNNLLKSRSYRVATLLAIKELGLEKKVSGAATAPPMDVLKQDATGRFTNDENFVIALYQSRDQKSGPDEVIMTAEDFLKVRKWAMDFLGFSGRENDNDPLLSVSFRQALSSGMDEDYDLVPIVRRAMNFEKQLSKDQIAGISTTIGGLAEKLASMTPQGGLEKTDPELDVAAVSYMISVSQTSKRAKDAAIVSPKRGSGARMFAGKRATVVTPAGPVTRANAGISGEDGPETGRTYQRKFNIFEVEPNADISDPNTKVRVRPIEEIGAMDDRIDDPNDPRAKRTFKPVTFGRPVDAMRRLLGGGKPSGQQDQSPQAPKDSEVDFGDTAFESTDLSDLMNVLEYWDK